MGLELDTSVASSAQSSQAVAPAHSPENGAVAELVGCERTQRRIVAHILQHTAPAPLPAPWTFLPANGIIRMLPCAPAELIASLHSTFSAAELQAARILAAGATGDIQLAPVLLDRLVRVLLNSEGEPVDLASDSGALFSFDPPCFNKACQRVPAAGKTKRMFVASLEDVQVLQCLGLRCTPAAGLAHLDGQQVRRLFPNPSPISRPGYQLTLVGASLSNLDHKLPAYLEPILNRLHAAQLLYECHENSDPFQVWLPSVHDFDRIRAAVTFSDRELIRREICASVDDFVFSTGAAWSDFHAPAKTDIASFHADLISVISASGPWGSGSEVKGAKDRLTAALDHATTRRFLQAAGAAGDPLQSEMLLLRAEVIQDLNQNYGPLRAAMSGGHSSCQYSPTLSDERLERIERGTNLLLKIERLSRIMS